MPKQSSFSAVDSLTGYLYQVRYALLDALKRVKDDVRFSVSIETLDDIVFESDGQPVELLQAKHHSKPANLTDTSTDLWKTIRIWVGQYKTGVNSRYYLVTTATAKDGTVASYLRVDGNSDIKRVVSVLEHISKIVFDKNNNTSQMNESEVILKKTIIANQNAAVVLQPSKQTFHFPSSAIAA
jgi:hypothetical protein